MIGTVGLPLDLGILESDKRFQTMCYYLARKEFPRAIPVAHGSWDGGRDILCFSGMLAISYGNASSLAEA